MCKVCPSLLGAVLVLPVTAAVHAQGRPPGNAPATFQGHAFKASNGETLPYSLFVPKGPPQGKLFPLVVCLHGSGTYAARSLAVAARIRLLGRARLNIVELRTDTAKL